MVFRAVSKYRLFGPVPAAAGPGTARMVRDLLKINADQARPGKMYIALQQQVLGIRERAGRKASMRPRPESLG